MHVQCRLYNNTVTVTWFCRAIFDCEYIEMYTVYLSDTLNS